jgi:methionyl-tRNA synthetase
MKYLKMFENMCGESMEDETSNIINNKCPNCGASLHDDNCEYCGSFFGKRTKKSTINKIKENDVIDNIFKYASLQTSSANNYHMINE